MDKKTEMTEEEKENRKKVLQSRLNHYKQSKYWHINKEKVYKSKIDFMDGLILGLFLGIFGNVFVQYLYAFTEGLFVKEILVILNTLIFVISAVILTVIFYKFRQKKKYAQKGIEIEKEGQGILTGAIIDTEFELEDLEKKVKF